MPEGIFSQNESDEVLEQLESASDSNFSDAALRAEAGFDPSQLDAERKRIESKLSPIDVGDALFGKATQTVEIFPGKFSVTYKMLLAGHRSAILSAIQERFGSSTVTTQEMAHYQQTLVLACSIQKIQEAELQDPLDQNMRFNKEILERNRKMILSLTDILFWKVWFNYVWFCDRVLAVQNEEAIKNS